MQQCTFGYSVPFEPNHWYRIRARYGKSCEASMLAEVVNMPQLYSSLLAILADYVSGAFDRAVGPQRSWWVLHVLSWPLLHCTLQQQQGPRNGSSTESSKVSRRSCFHIDLREDLNTGVATSNSFFNHINVLVYSFQLVIVSFLRIQMIFSELKTFLF